MLGSVRLVAHAALLALGCGSTGNLPEARRPARHATTARASQPVSLYNEAKPSTERVELGSLHFVGMDDGPVPEFRLTDINGRVFDSTTLVGSEPFVVVFFATWCEGCDAKLDALREAMAELGPVTVIGVVVDGPETRARVPSFLSEHGVSFPLVLASAHPRFNIEYNPFSTVPLVVVVGKNGGLVDFQLGSTLGDKQRLVSAVQLARNIGPLAYPGRLGNGSPQDD